MELSQIAASHIVHIYALVLPDYHRLDMLSGLDNEIRRLIRMKEAVNGVTALFGGRALHPVTMVVGGFTKIPPKDEIAKLIEQLEGIKDDALETVKMASGLACPELQGDVEYVALVKEDEYAVNEGMIATSSGLKTDLAGYYSFFEEHQVPYANAKRTTMKGKRPIMVGALSRLHMKFHALHPEAKKAAVSAGFAPSENNPFFNIMAQAIEVVHCIYACSDLLRGLDCRETLLKVTPREGAGAAMTEAPRGLLYHEYQVNKRGVIEKANLVTPTAYNFQGLEENLKKMVRDNIDTPADELSLLCEMLVRAYDPCFSCSVH